MKISLCIPFHLRGERKNECLKKTFQHYETLATNGFIDELHFCGSEGALSYGFYEDTLLDNLPFSFGQYFEIPQKHITISSAGDDVLRKKFNDSLATLSKSDWYVLAGANDIVSPEFFEQLRDVDPSGIKMCGTTITTPLFMMDELNEWKPWKFQIRYPHYPFKLNPCINAFSQGAMDHTKNQPYFNKGCETGAEIYFAKHGNVIPLNGVAVSLKGKHDLNTISKVSQRHKQLDISPKEMEYLRSIL